MDFYQKPDIKFFFIKFWFSVKMALHGVTAKPLRTTLTVLGVTIGVASIVSLMGIGEGARTAVLEQYESFGSNVIKITANKTAYEFEPKLAQELTERVSELKYASPVVEIETSMQWKRTRGKIQLLGVNEQFMAIRDHKLEYGNFLSQYQVKLRSNVAVLGSNVSENIMNGRSPVGRYISLNGESYEIIGVLEKKGEGKADGVDDKIVVPYTCAQKISDKRTAESIWGKADSDDNAKLAVVQISRIIKKQYNLGDDGSASSEGVPPTGDEEMMMEDEMMMMEMGFEEETPSEEVTEETDSVEVITITNMNDMVQEADESNRVMTLLLGGIAAVALLVGGLGVMNIMLVSVSERTEEIGVRRALGAQKSDLLMQFLLEALFICLVGSITGVLLGIGGVFMFAHYGFDAMVSINAIVVASGVSIISGLIFGVWPAMTASSIPPVEALKR